MRRMTGMRIAAALLALAAVSCGTRRTAGVTFHDSNMDFSLIQNAAVLPFVNLSPSQTAGERVRDVFMTMLQATGGVYVLPPGEVARGTSRASVANPAVPTPEEVVALAKLVKADVVITGTLREYGEVRSGSSAASVVSLSVQMMEGQSGRVVWSASSTQGGVGVANRLFGGGGKPMDVVTERAVSDLLDQLFKK
jgi:polysaccharide biosynthesis protein PelC